MIESQATLFQKVDGLEKETIVENQKLLKEVFSIVKQEKDREAAATQLHKLFLRSSGDLTMYYGTIDMQIQFFNSVWFRYYLNYEPTNALKQIRIPVLALNGELDMQVSSKQNLLPIGKALKEARNPDYTIRELPKLNHAFQTCQTGAIREYAMIEETVSPEVLSILSDWIFERTVKP